MVYSHLPPEVHETWHFILCLSRDINLWLSSGADGDDYLCNLDFLATKRGKRDVCIIIVKCDLKVLGKIMMLPATLKTIVDV